MFWVGLLARAVLNRPTPSPCPPACPPAPPRTRTPTQEEAQKLRLRAMLGEPLVGLVAADASPQFESVGADGKPTPGPLLCGHGSRRLLRLTEREVNELERFRRIYCFFTSANGLQVRGSTPGSVMSHSPAPPAQEFWDLLRLCHERLLHRTDDSPAAVARKPPPPDAMLTLASATGSAVRPTHACLVVQSARQCADSLQRHATARRGMVRQGPSTEELAGMVRGDGSAGTIPHPLPAPHRLPRRRLHTFTCRPATCAPTARP